MHHSPISRTFSFILIVLASLFACSAHAQVGIGTTSPNANAILELDASTQGFLPPRFDPLALTLGAAEEGMMVYRPSDDLLYVWNGSAWQPLATGGSTPWNTNGSGIDYTAGNVGIGMAAPDEELVVVNNLNKAVVRVASIGVSATDPGSLELGNIRGTYASPTPSQNGDVLGQIDFLGTNGGSIVNPAASIRTEIGTSVPAGKVPGSIVFSTTPLAGAPTTPEDRMVIRNNEIGRAHV